MSLQVPKFEHKQAGRFEAGHESGKNIRTVQGGQFDLGIGEKLTSIFVTLAGVMILGMSAGQRVNRSDASAILDFFAVRLLVLLAIVPATAGRIRKNFVFALYFDLTARMTGMFMVQTASKQGV